MLSSDRVIAGSALRGVLVLTNRTGTPLHVSSCPGDGALAVGLGSAAIPFQPTDGEVRCHMVIGRGRTSLPVQIATTYAGCGRAGEPRCRRGSSPIPPLPAGTYRTAVDLTGVPLAVAPPPITVTLVGR